MGCPVVHLEFDVLFRSMFWAQVIATVIAGTTQLGVQAWMFSNIPDICDPHQKDGLVCPGTEVFGTASIIWGVIGPARQFSKGQIYYGMYVAYTSNIVTLKKFRPYVFLPHRLFMSADRLSCELEISKSLASIPQVSRNATHALRCLFDTLVVSP